MRQRYPLAEATRAHAELEGRRTTGASVLLPHYFRGETVIEAYWKSVRMPGQGLFVGEPLARPYNP